MNTSHSSRYGTRAPGAEQIDDAGFAVVAPADHRRIGEQHQAGRDDDVAPGAGQADRKRRARQRGAGGAAIPDAGHEDDQPGRRADEDRVDEHFEDAVQTLADRDDRSAPRRAPSARCRGRLRSRTVRARCRSAAPASSSSPQSRRSPRAPENAPSKTSASARGNLAGVTHEDEQAAAEIEDRHERHQDLRDLADALDAAENDDRGDGGEDDARDGRARCRSDACRLSATELACTMLPMPKAASATRAAKIVPSHGRPSPFSVYIAPPRIVPGRVRLAVVHARSRSRRTSCTCRGRQTPTARTARRVRRSRSPSPRRRCCRRRPSTPAPSPPPGTATRCRRRLLFCVSLPSTSRSANAEIAELDGAGEDREQHARAEEQHDHRPAPHVAVQPGIPGGNLFEHGEV